MKERVQLNISVTREQKLALQALAEGHGTSVTKLVLGLIELAPTADSKPESLSGEGGSHTPSPVDPGTPVRQVGSAGASMITSPVDVPSAVERVVERNALSVSHQARAFTPYSKEQQTGKAAKKTKPTVDVKSCRHGLLRCKVCGTG